jgi:hypothetical protein
VNDNIDEIIEQAYELECLAVGRGFSIDPLEGISVDIEPKALLKIGDVATLCYTGMCEDLPRNLTFNSEPFQELQLQPIDDYYGITEDHPCNTDGGDDVIVWIIPLQNGEEMFHSPGPFDKLRISFNILRNCESGVQIFVKTIGTLCAHIPAITKQPIELYKQQIHKVRQFWLENGIEPGSEEAFEIDV